MKALLYFKSLFLIFLFFGIRFQGIAQCTANFTYNISANGQVNFSSTSVGTSSVTNYNWDFNNINFGSASFSGIGVAGMNPSHTYSANGVYYASLNIWSAVPSCSSNVQYSLNITNATNTCVLSASFTTQNWNQTNGLVSFGNNSTGTSAGATYTWNYGDGGTAVGLSPAHQYTSNGTYLVTLLANNNYTSLCTSTYTANVIVNSICGFTGNVVNGTIINGITTFTALIGGANAQTNFNWNFGDNTSTSGQGLGMSIVSHTYYANGNYPVTLWLSSVSPSCNVQFTTSINITNAPTPTCNLAANFTFSQSANGFVAFNNTSSGTVAQTTYTWNFGTGMSWGNFNANLASPSHVYLNNQPYIVTLTVSNNFVPACVSTHSALINVSSTACNLIPGLSYSVSPNGLVNFTNTTTGGNASPGYNWDFGDNIVNTGFNPISHTYSVNGTYNVYAVLLSSAPSCTATAFQTITVSTATGTPCNLVPSFLSTQGVNGLVNFISTSTGTNAGSTYNWNFGNGQSASSNPASCTFTANGLYAVSLLVDNNSAPPCANTITQTINVTNVPCNLQSSFIYSVGVSGSVSFTNTSTGTNTNTGYFWNFGNGIWVQSPSLVQSYLYPSAGTYSVVLNVYDMTNSLCVSNSTQNITITNIPCVANAGFTVYPTNTPLFWTATPSFPWNVTSATWNWGDGSSSNQLYTSHTYSAAGIYNLCLTVTVSCSSTASSCASYSISKLFNIQSLNMIQIDVIEPLLTEIGINTMPTVMSGINVFPNPSHGNLTIQSDNPMDGSVNISIYNLLGECVYTKEIESLNGNLKEEIKVESFSKGLYVLKLKNLNSTYTTKIMFDE